MALESSLLLRPGDKVGSMQEVITCVINQDPQLRKIWNKVFKDHEQELQRALGEVKSVSFGTETCKYFNSVVQKRWFSQSYFL